MKRIQYGWWVLIWMVVGLGQAYGAPRVIEMAECVERVMAGSPEHRILKLENQLAQQETEKARSVYDLTWRTSLTLDRSTSSGSSPFLRLDTSDTVVGHSGVTALLPELGTRLDAGIQVIQQVQSGQLNEVTGVDPVTHLALTQASAYQKEGMTPQVVVGVSHPLLNNRGGVLTGYPVHRAVQMKHLKALSTTLAREALKTRYRNLYIAWVVQENVVAQLTRASRTAADLHDNMIEKQIAGIVDGDDVEKAYAARQRLDVQRQDAIVRRDAVAKAFSPFLKPGEWVPDFAAIQVDFVGVSSDWVAFEDTLSYAISALNQSLLNQELTFHSNRKEPELNVLGTLALGTRLSAQAAVVYSRELDNTHVNASVKSTQLKLAQQAERQTEQATAFSLRSAALEQEIRNHSRAIGQHQDIIRSLEKRKKVEQRKYNQARLNLSYLLETDYQRVQETIAVWQRRGALHNAVQAYRLLHVPASIHPQEVD